MNKTLKAILLGYIWFDVNGQRFYRYNEARAKRLEFSEKKIPVSFSGFNIYLLKKKWFWLTLVPYHPDCMIGYK